MTDQEILKLIKKATTFEKSQEVKRSGEDLTGQVIGCYKIGYNDNSGALFYRDLNNVWQPAKTKGSELSPPVNLQQVTNIGNSTTNNIQIVNGGQIGLYKGTGIKWAYGTAYQTLTPQHVTGEFNSLLLPAYNAIENPSNLPRVLGQTINNLPFDAKGNINIATGGGGGTASRFGVEDNLAIANRLFNIASNKFEIVSGDYIDFNNPTSIFRVRATSFDYYTQDTADANDSGFIFTPLYTQISQGKTNVIFHQLRFRGIEGMSLLSDNGPDFRSQVYMNGPSMFISSSDSGSNFFNKITFENQRVQIKQSNFDEVLNLSTANFTKTPGEYTVVKSVNGALADTAGNVVVAGSGANPVIPFYNNNAHALANGAALNSMYRLPYLSLGDYYPLALVGPGLQTFALTMGDNCNISTLSANVVMTNTDSGTVYNFVVTRSVFGVSFNPITVTILQGPYNFTISNI